VTAPWIAQLKPASFRGVPFGVLTSENEFGRRQAVHEYPFRDKPYVEDVGRGTRRFMVRAFLIEDSLIYGGGPVIQQQINMIAAAETKGPGTLVHPTLGTLTVSVDSGAGLTVLEQWDAGRYFEITLRFIESGDKIFPSINTSTPANVISAAATADMGASTDATNALASQLPLGAVAGQTAGAAVLPWAAELTSFGQDAASLYNLAAALPGNFGRFFNAANLSSFPSASGLLSQLASPTTTFDDLVAASSAAQTAIADALDTVSAVAANLGLGASNNSAADLATAIQAAVAAALASAANPADAIRLLNALEQSPPATAAGATTIGAAVNDLYRRAVVVALARAGTTYQPSSYNDANAVRALIVAALDAEIAIAGDEGDDPSFNALRALRVTVVQDLTARGATLAPIVTVQSAQSMPALWWAQRLYKDATRADQLVQEAGPVNPLFMPLSFQALSS
jgi:prophage DNA circulation protein